MIIQILDHITEEIKQIRVDVFIKEQGLRVDIFPVTQLEMHILGAWRYVSCIVDNI